MQGLIALLIGLLFCLLAWWFVSARFLLGIIGLAFIGGAVAAFFGMQQAFTLCRNWKGGECPKYGTQNEVTFWSL